MTPLVHSARLPTTGRSYLAVVVSRRYRLEPKRRATPLDDLVEPVIDPRYEEHDDPLLAARLVEDSHVLAIAKPFTDVLVRGSAHARKGPVEYLDTGVRVGAARKAVRVWGERTLRLGANGELAFSQPTRFATLPITWEHAYGGRDMYVELKEIADHIDENGDALPGAEAVIEDLAPISYPRNGAGRGWFIDAERERLVGERAPNLEDPTDPVLPSRMLASHYRDWIDRPVAAAYEPIDPDTFPRAAFVLMPTFDPPRRTIYEIGAGALSASDLTREPPLGSPPDARAFNCAPAGLAVGRLGGGEQAQLWNLHPEHDLLEFDLPADAPTFSLELPGVGRREFSALLQTVLIEPDLDRLTLTWAGSIEVAFPYPLEMTSTMPREVRWARSA